MAREKDEAKRQAILTAAKRLFASRGYHGTSVSDLAAETKLPVGSIYTYFESKDEVIKTVIDEGWNEFIAAVESVANSAVSPEAKLSLILHRFLPSLFEDVDFISLILAEAGLGSSLNEKLERLASLLGGLVLELAASRDVKLDFPVKRARAAISIFFLGSMDTIRISRKAGLGVDNEDIVGFIRLAIENAFGVRLEPSIEASIR